MATLLQLAGTVGGTALAGPAGGAVGGGLGGILTNLFGGSGRDAQRQARADWFTAQALQGSVIAARVLLGGTTNTASHESPMYRAAISKVQSARPDVMTAANNAGAYWDTTDNDSSDHMRALVNNELATINATTANVGSGAQLLPVMTTTATPYTPTTTATLLPTAGGVSPMLLAVAGLGAVVLLILATRRH